MSSDEAVYRLGIEALDSPFKMHSGKIVGRPIVAGRITPPNWAPGTGKIFLECYGEAIKLLIKLAAESRPCMRDKIISISSSNGRDFIRYGFIGLLDELVHRLNPSAREKLLIIKTIELYLNYDAPKGDLREGERQYMESVDKLMSFLYPSNFEDRLTQALGRDYWEYTKEFRESSGEGVKEDDIIQIASEFIKTPELFHKYRHLLFSNEAKAAGIIGKKLGEMDREGVFLTMIFSVVKEYTNLSFLTGYIASLSEKHPEMIPRINTELDNLEVKEPIISYNIFRSVPLISNALQRCLDLVKAKKLQAHYLGFIYYSELFEKMSNQDLVEVLTTIRDYMQGDEENSEEAAIHICSKAATKKFRQNVLDTPELLKLIWYFLERTAENGGGDYYWWGKTMEKLMEDNAGRAAKVCLLGLIGDHYNHAKNCEKLLARLAKQDSRVVMDAIGSKIFDEKLLFKFQVNVFNDIFSATNSNAVAYFLDKYGLEGARLIARHLPSPYLKDGKEPLVPPVTETVLTRFGDDEKTLRNFLAGRHGYQVYSGDISAQKLIEAEAAKPFLGHHISAVRRWAKFEVTSGKSDAEYWKIHNEEMDLE